MKRTKEQLIESGVRKIMNKVLNEEVQLDGQDAKLIAEMVKGLATVPFPDHRTNDQFVKKKYDELAGIRIELMNYLEKNSPYKFTGTRDSWKLVKK